MTAQQEPEYRITEGALNKQDLLSRLVVIDENAPDIRTVEQELQRMIADIRKGRFDHQAISLEPHTLDYITRIRRSSKALNDSPFIEIISASLSIASTWYEDGYATGEHDAAIAATVREEVLDTFLDEIRKEDFENCGFIDMDSIEAVYIRIKESLRSEVKNHDY